MRDSRYDILFEPLPIGPVTAPNRFYQVPHCNGMGRMFPNAMIAMRETKAEGGWGIVCTEQCDFHVTSDIQPYTETNLWDEGDELYLDRMVEARASARKPGEHRTGAWRPGQRQSLQPGSAHWPRSPSGLFAAPPDPGARHGSFGHR